MASMADEENVNPAGAPSRLARVTEGRVLGGVCTGLGRYTRIDPVVFRVGFAILVLVHGQGVLLYIAAVLVMPAAPDRPAVLEQLFRRRFDGPGALSILGALLCASVAFSLVGTGLMGPGASSDALALLTVSGVVLMVAHARGVDLVAAARSFPERLQGHQPGPERPADTSAGRPAGASQAPGASFGKGPVSLDKMDVPGRSGGGLPEGMIDLATLSRPRGGAGRGRDRVSDPVPDGRPGAPVTPGPSGAQAVPLDKGCGKHPALTSVTLLAAMAAAAAVFPVARTQPGPEAVMIMSATALAVVGAGLLAGGWFRARGLATVGTLLTCSLLTTAVAAEAPPGARWGEVEWRPVDATRTQQHYKVAAGVGRLDLSALPLRPGQRMTVNAEVVFGGLRVTVPAAARVEIDARVGLGDLDLPGRTISGPSAKVDHVLEPENPETRNPPVIALRIRGRIGDVRVTRA
ncbi:PspC domain-containing protein [Actinomadura viridis]|uniref:Phage shock protein PspC (Stress-responsive transcriptional regulator) n=1 Tax=Actinomadura viridis TaxID=58110 RepID=A0A931DGX2_9ACTN|nr:PspC domain-containing protein [Actinomadura viridis]MBG6086528.1 phage shock protein PspC (stress-responsive transcriptional regulator) [Actinomadura viridis]